LICDTCDDCGGGAETRIAESKQEMGRVDGGIEQEGALPMDQPYAQPHAQPQFVMMPVAQRNGLGTFGFLVALIGFFIPTGIVALLGLVLSLAAIGRSPRGMAAMGVIIGLLGTVFWLVVMGAALVVGVVAALGIAVVTAAGFAIMNPEVLEVSSDMVNVVVAVEEYKQDHEKHPAGLTDLALGVSITTDPWGGTYRLVSADPNANDGLDFDIVSGGPDGLFDTEDDIRLSRLDRFWEQAFENFEDQMNEFGERMERLEGLSMSCNSASSACGESDPKPASTYEAYEAEAEALVDRLERLSREVAGESSE
jgi:hypothetical protein